MLGEVGYIYVTDMRVISIISSNTQQESEWKNVKQFCSLQLLQDLTQQCTSQNISHRHTDHTNVTAKAKILKCTELECVFMSLSETVFSHKPVCFSVVFTTGSTPCSLNAPMQIFTVTAGVSTMGGALGAGDSFLPYCILWQIVRKIMWNFLQIPTTFARSEKQMIHYNLQAPLSKEQLLTPNDT